jgi:hypothetical protein
MLRLLCAVILSTVFWCVGALAGEAPKSETTKERAQQLEWIKRCLSTYKCSKSPKYLTIKKFDSKHRVVLTYEDDMGVVLQFRIEL